MADAAAGDGPLPRSVAPGLRAAGPGVPPSGRSVYLQPGDVFASDRPAVVSTILGSCVSVVLWDPARSVGGANHFLLSHWPKSGEGACRFGGPAMETLLAKVLALGGDRLSLTARLFGGASLFAAPPGRVSIGEQNVGVATRFLEEARIPVLGRETGGTRGRKVVFDTASGGIWVKTL